MTTRKDNTNSGRTTNTPNTEKGQRTGDTTNTNLRKEPTGTERPGTTGTRTDLREDRSQREDRDLRDEDRRNK